MPSLLTLVKRRAHRAYLRMRRPDVANALDMTDDVTLVGARARVVLWDAVGSALAAGPGDVAELGSHRGGTAGVIAERIKADPSRTLHLYDRWGDLPDTTPEDGNMADAYKRTNIGDKLAWLA